MEAPIPVLVYPINTSPRAWGKLHGERFAVEIASLAEIRIGLSIQVGAFEHEAQVLEVARLHLEILEAYDLSLYEELMGMAEGAGCTPEHIVIINQYTDLRDISPNCPTGELEDSGDEGCTVVFGRGLPKTTLGFTWDTHSSATDYTLLLGIPPRSVGGQTQPGMWLLTIVGCLGMAGVSNKGVGAVINNLKSTDARVGVIWPAIIRKMLRDDSADAAYQTLEQSSLASGHHYLIADAQGEGVGVETSGARSKIVFDTREGAPPRARFHHTNHCLNDWIEEVSLVGATSTTFERYACMATSLTERPLDGLDDLWQRLVMVSYDRDLKRPLGIATCAAICMEMTGGEVRGYCLRGPVGRGSERKQFTFENGAPVLLPSAADSNS